MTQALQTPTFFGTVMECTMKDDLYAAILVSQRLPAIADPDDRQSATTKGNSGFGGVPLVVGTAVCLGLTHGPQNVLRQRPLSSQIDGTGDSGHRLTLVRNRCKSDHWVGPAQALGKGSPLSRT
jgi:hypothetical protein